MRKRPVRKPLPDHLPPKRIIAAALPNVLVNLISPLTRARSPDSKPLVIALEAWMREHRGKLARHAPVAIAIDYMLNFWSAFIRFLDDGWTCLTNNAAERSLRSLVPGRKLWLFCGSDRDGQRAAMMYSLIQTAKMNDVDPQTWLADVLGRINEHPNKQLDELLPWNWKPVTAF